MTLQEAIKDVANILEYYDMRAHRESLSIVLEAARKQLDWHTEDCTTCNNEKGKWGWEPCDHCVRHASNNWTPKEE